MLFSILLISSGILVFLFLRAIFFQSVGTTNHITAYKERFEVDLTKCEVITRESAREIPDVDISDAISSVLDTDLYSSDTSSINCTYVKYKANAKIYFAGPIAKSEIAVRKLFLDQRCTYIYYNAISENDYFFDLRFLNDK